jgi:hypothetical protein
MSKSISLNIYELELSKTYKRLYRTFLISLLKPYSRKKNEKPPKLIDLDKEDRFQVESIRKKRNSKKKFTISN